MSSEPSARTVRPYREGDEAALVQLFERVFQRPLTQQQWRWKLKQLPCAVENVWLALDGERPIFHYAGIPVPFQLDHARGTVMVSVDTMTDPDYRRQGLLSTVGRQVYDTWRAAGIPFVLGLPNERWGSRAAVLGWQKLFPLQWLVRILRPEALAARRIGWPALARLQPAGRVWRALSGSRSAGDPTVTVEPVDDAGPQFDWLWQLCQADAAFSVIRDSRWVNWRYLALPSADYLVLLARRGSDPAGYAAVRVAGSAPAATGTIAELFTAADDAAARAALIAEATFTLLAAGAAKALTLAVPGTASYRSFLRAGFRPALGAFSVELVPLAAHLPLERLRDPAEWGLTGGDFDVV